MTKKEILDILDNSADGYYSSFVSLGYGYSYLIDARLNVFVGDNNQWAIAIERLGYNPRAGYIDLDIYYYGNCLINLESYNDKPVNNYTIQPIENENFENSIDGEYIKKDAKFWLIRGHKITLEHNKKNYIQRNIIVREDEFENIGIEDAARLLIINNSNLFRATEVELYRSIPSDLKKILVIDEWYHKDYNYQTIPEYSNEYLRIIYEHNNIADSSFEEFAESFNKQSKFIQKINNTNKPSSYETWQLIANVIRKKDVKEYKPTLKPNTHWSNWPDSGSL